MKSETTGAGVHIFGVRHLSPGGAQHLLSYLHEIKPTAVLIEGPADATPEIRHLINTTTKPPIAILAFTEEIPVRTALWPLAVYSPEYQAMKWAEQQGAFAAFIDLPSSVVIALQDLRIRSREDAEQQGKSDDHEADDSSKVIDESSIKQAPKSDSLYDTIAELAGELDYEMYWERNFEHNMSRGAYKDAIISFSSQMRLLSEENERNHNVTEYAHNAIREAYMRRQIQNTIASGHHPEKIVVLCGAYHAAALADSEVSMTDEEIDALPSLNTKLTLMPYTYYKLSSLSGYGAGNLAPHYYQMMWERMKKGSLEDLPHHYLSTVARYLRNSGTHRSTAEIIEAVRLAESLAALHGGSAPTLRDLRDAALTLLGRGELSVIAEALARTDIGTAIGELAEGISQTPIQDDLNRQLKRFKLEKYKTPVANDLELDLRENRRVSSEEAAYQDLNRSFLFHRLRLLGIDLVNLRASGQARATWAEHWVMKWSPEVEIQVVESTLLGETIEIASAYVLQQKLDHSSTIAEASALIRTAYECGMLHQMEAGRQTLQRLAVDTRDVVQITASIHELSVLIQYGDVRQIDTKPLIPLLEQLFRRACLFLLDASQCNDEASGEMLKAMNILNQTAIEHSETVDELLWVQELRHLSERDDCNPRLSGVACSILLERNAMTTQQCAEEVSRRLSPGIPAELGAGWFEGMSMRNRYVLLSRLSLWEQLNDYINSLDDEEFVRALVFLRRAFSTFAPREKTMIAELLGELWGVNTEQAAEILTGELKEAEVKMIEDLNDFDFGDI